MPLFTSTAVAASPSVTRTVTNKVLSNNVATITVSSAHPFVVGDRVSVTGVDSTFNGTHRITVVPSSVSFSYGRAASDVASTSATGTVTLQTVLWKNITDMFVNVGGLWKRVNSGFVKVGTQWKQFFSTSLTPSIASTVTISSNSTSFPATLTGTNFNWTDATSLTYVFQKSSDNASFTNIGSAQTITNPAVSNTVTLTLARADFPAFTSYFRFSVTGTNSTFGTSFTSTSTSVTVNKGAPFNTVAPSISPTSGTAGVTSYSVTNGTWDPDDSDGIYAYQWQAFDTPTYVTAPGTSTNSTYTPPSDFLTLYSSPIRCRVRATNSVGSTDAFSDTATVSAPAATPSASSLTTADGTITPGDPSSITVANTATTNEGKVSWTNGSNATSSWVSSVTPGSSYTGTDGGTLLTEQLFTITSTATAVATVNNKNNNKRVTISWNQSDSASYRVNYTITNAGLANGTYNQDGNSTASSESFTVTLGNVSGTVRANSVTVYSGANQTGTSFTFTPTTAPSTSPTDKTSSATGSGSVTFASTTTAPSNVAVTVTSSIINIGGENYQFYPGVTLTADVTADGTTPFTYSYTWSRSSTSLETSAYSTVGTNSQTLATNSTYNNRWVRCTVVVTNSAGNATGTSINYFITSAI